MRIQPQGDTRIDRLTLTAPRTARAASRERQHRSTTTSGTAGRTGSKLSVSSHHLTACRPDAPGVDLEDAGGLAETHSEAPAGRYGRSVPWRSSLTIAGVDDCSWINAHLPARRRNCTAISSWARTGLLWPGLPVPAAGGSSQWMMLIGRCPSGGTRLRPPGPRGGGFGRSAEGCGEGVGAEAEPDAAVEQRPVDGFDERVGVVPGAGFVVYRVPAHHVVGRVFTFRARPVPGRWVGYPHFVAAVEVRIAVMCGSHRSRRSGTARRYA